MCTLSCEQVHEAVQQVLTSLGWQINTAFVERLNLTICQHVAAVGRRVTTLCKGEDGLRQQLALYQTYYNCCLPHAALRQPLPCSCRCPLMDDIVLTILSPAMT